MAENDEFQQRQEAYEQAYYEAAQAAQAQPVSDAQTPVQEQYHTDPLVGVISQATQQRAEWNAYQQPWDSASAGSSYGQQPYQGFQSEQPYYAGGYQQQAYGQQAYDQPSGQESYYQPYNTGYYPYTVSKDHVAAGLLALFLGVFGVHKFYLGYNTAGFIMLGISIIGSIFTFGLAWIVMVIISITEGIIYLVKPQRMFDAIYVQGHREWF